MNKYHVHKVVSVLRHFLRSRGLSFKTLEKSKLSITFKPGTKIKFLGFDFYPPNYKNIIFKKGKFTKIRTTGRADKSRLCDSTSASVFLVISKQTLKNQTTKLKKLLERNVTSWGINRFITKINEHIKDFSKKYNVSTQAKYQLKKLSNYVYLRFVKILFTKFKSKCKAKKYVTQTFLTQRSITFKKIKLLKYEDIRLAHPVKK
jgi:hypothetical protein